LPQLDSESVDAVVCDPMYGVASTPRKGSTYGFGPEPFDGTAEAWWRYHEPIYRECRRVLKPGGRLSWAMGCKFRHHFRSWFGGYRIWSTTRYYRQGMNAFGHVWLTQNREQRPVRFPDRDSLIICERKPAWRNQHPCPKPVREMEFYVRHLSKPGDVVLDCFCGLGSTCEAAKRLGRQYIGCDVWPEYVRLAREALARIRPLRTTTEGLT
jgi:site-specific DNA-methyltransferase (adenine-specific)